ncbi:cytochrome ubiquinol oxidase subunit I [Phytoactinopolyspora mesophila]|uniref:Cytochrome ubiquinol oxidase subunit I n=1 Tax=Phytoactinopolyspora mesophila TaxID=2650750 RepID=A0A7K3LZ40_9ACTN|nr:cytochrome ubiquinol oxidase subunit I [Phytoactinopolyspora mesophila]NDL56295.1 cytochrome ubiquinol oxidase subunit I [Phytoactinopolyspora mesophila]
MTPETLELARLQFALTAGAHFLFVALTLGLATTVACLQLRATITNSPVHTRMVRFWGQLYVINYAMGIVTGLVMELQFGMSWSGLTHFAGNVFGAALAMETLVAFFIESTFLGLWIFGWGRMSRWLHLGVIWVVTLTAYASAYWILVANGFMQNPVGAEIDGDGSMRLTDLTAMLTNPSAIGAFWHILGGALLTSGFFLAGVSAYHLRRRTDEREFFGRSLRIGVFASVPALFLTVASGGIQFSKLEDIQPMKLAVFAADNEEIDAIQAAMIDQFGAGTYEPPGLARAGGTLMLVAFAAMFWLVILGALLAMSKKVIVRARAWHVVLMASLPLPFIAMISGWIFREVGRQPWVIYEMLTVEDAVSDISDGAMRVSLLTFTTLFGVLVFVTIWLMARHARRGPGAVTLGSPATDGTAPEPSDAVLTFVGK